MSQKTKTELKNTFADGHLVTGADFIDLIDSLKGYQSPVSSPTASGSAVQFIDSISQDAEGVVTATKKSVNFSGYQTTSGMSNYQINDVQEVGDIIVAADEEQSIEHKKNHYPVVRLLDVDTGLEVRPSEYTVKHNDVNTLVIHLGVSLGGMYKYILD